MIKKENVSSGSLRADRLTEGVHGECFKIEEVQGLIIELRGEQVLIDADVAEIYGVETKKINRAVSNNPGKFPAGYVLKTIDAELDDLRRKFSTAKFAKTRANPKAFTEKNLYMLATILKSSQAT